MLHLQGIKYPAGGNAPRSVRRWVRWSMCGCQACWACRASWACWWQPGSLFLAEAASAMCPLRRQTSSGASAAGGCRAAPQPALSVVRVPSLPSSVCPAQPQPEAAARGCVGGGGMLGGGRQTPPQPNLRGMRACLCDIFEHFTFGSVTFICFEI